MPIRARSLLFLPVVFFVVFSASANPKVRDQWLAYLEGDQRFGSQRAQVTELPDGNYLYLIESRFKVDPFGERRQQITFRGEYVVNRDLGLVSIQSELDMESGTVKTSGVVENGVFSLSITSSGETKESTIQLEPADRIVVDVALEDWLASLADEDESSSRKILDSDGWTLRDYVATRSDHGKEGSTWDIEIAGSSRQITLRRDANGVTTDLVVRNPDAHLVRCTEQEAKEIDYIDVDPRLLLNFPLDRDIGALSHLTSLTVKLSWLEIPFEEFELSDRRQRLVEKTEDEGNFSAVLKISRPAVIEDNMNYPVKGKEFEGSLAESDCIKPHHEEIMKAARSVVQGQDTALNAVKALSAWVSGYIDGKMIPETLTGPEVLARKTGKCTEYATLFASLARSLGIPTRMALGERLVRDKWMGHMWNEAYVGQWISVDATVDEVGESLALLKFIHSDTVAGTQSIRWKLTESLKIEVVEHEIDPVSEANKVSEANPVSEANTVRTGIVNRTYTNVDFECRVTAPVPSWKIEPKTSSSDVTVRFRIPDKNKVALHFLAFNFREGADPKVVTDGRLQSFRSTQKEFELLLDDPLPVNGSKGQTTRFNFQVPSQEGEANHFRVTEVVWTRGSFGYLLNLVAPQDLHDELLADFEKLLFSFEGLSP